MSAKQWRYGLIGAGMMGREHIRNINLMNDIKLVSMSDPHANSIEQSLMLIPEGQDVTTYEHHKQMMDNEDLDAVIIASPNHTHFEIVKDLLDAPIALLVEKPLCTKLEDAKTIAAKAANRKALFWVGLEYRYMPPVTRFIERLHQGEAGQIRMLSIREHRFPFLPKVNNWNRFSENTGGTLVEKCCHFFDLMRVIMKDEPVRVYATGGQNVNHLEERYDGRTPDILDNAYVSVDFARGGRAMLDLCMFAEGSIDQEEIYAIGEKGKLEVKIPDAHVTWSPRGQKAPVAEFVETPPLAMAAGDHHGATYFQLLRFHNALINNLPSDISADDGLRSVEIGIAAHQSILHKTAIDL